MPRGSSTSVRHDAVPEQRVQAAARAWALRLRQDHPEVIRIGYFGSYARGDYVPRSDLDVLIEVSGSVPEQRADRAQVFQPDSFPVGVDIFVYTSDELAALRAAGASFIRAIDSEICWLVTPC
jgi:predicted nucleotidyltransferase